MPQPQPRQLSGFNDMQMLQQQIMFKQLQELQRRQQLQDLGDSRQQNYINHLSAINSQASGGQFQPLINGTPIHDPQMFMVGNMSLLPRDGSPAAQGVANGVLYSQAQQFDPSLYGTPISSARNNLIQYPHMQGISNDAANELTRDSKNGADKPIIQSSAFGNSSLGNNCNVSSDLHCMPDEAFVSKQVLQGKNLFGQIPVQAINTSEDFSGGQERTSWPGLFPGKSTQVKSSQGLATLDPMEEKILFNMDDNSWDASFGRHTDIGSGGFGNTLESTDYSGSFPSIQSGSWSALMQSAVAEASSSDTGLQEEWSGLSFQNTELSPDNQPLNFLDSGKHQTGSKPQLLLSDSNISSVFPGFQQSGIQFPANQREGLLSDSSHESIQQSEIFSSNCKPQKKQPIEETELIQTYLPLENGWHGRNYEHPETDTHQRIISSYNNEGQSFKRQIGRNIESPSPIGNAVPSVCNIENSVNRTMHIEKDHDNRYWKNENNTVDNSFSNSVGGVEQLKFGADNKIFEREDLQSNIVAAAPSSSMSKVEETSGHVPESHQLSPQVLVNSYDVADETYANQRNCYQREKSSDSYHSNTSKQTITGHDLRDNLRFQSSNSRPVAEDNKKPYGQVGQKAYHPMRNLGLSMEHTQQFSQGSSSREQGYLGQFKFMGNIPNGGVNLEKGRLPDVQRYSKVSEEVSPRGNVGANLSASFNKSCGFDGPNENVQSSQNILQLLHKVDHGSKNNNVIRFGSTDSIPQLAVPVAERPEASVSQHNNHSSASPRFGLRLAPPSQRLPNPNNVFSSQNSPQTGNSTAISSSESPYLRNQLSVASQQPQGTLPGIARGPPHCNRAISQDSICTNLFGQQFPILETVPITQPSVMSGMSQQVGFSIKPPGVWTNVSTQPRLSSDSTNNNLQTTSSTPHEPHNQNSYRGGPTSLEFGEQPKKERSQQEISSETLDTANVIGSGSCMARPQEQDFGRAEPGGNRAPAVSERDFEAFGRSLKPTHVLHQINSLKKAETDPSKRISEEYNGADPDLNPQKETSVTGHNLMHGHNSGVKKPTDNELNKMLGFFPDGRKDQSVKDSSQPLYRDPPHEMVMVGQSSNQGRSSSTNVAYNRTEHSQNGFQMGPSWFKHYGILKNGQMLPMYDARAAKNAAQQFLPEKPIENLHTNTSILSAVKQSPPDVLPPEVSNQNVPVVRPKKRKSAVFKLLPWHKEVAQGSQRPESISMAELEWAQATNRLIEKAGNEAEMTEDVQPVGWPKKRLILTTHLMQQVFRPAPASILSVDASSNYDSVAYSAARLALGDACSLTSCSCSDSFLSSDIDLMSEKPKIPERYGKQYFSKIVEDFTKQAEKLETDFSRLEKRTSILDARVEIQELEKFAVINRFAKFHSRGQSDTAGTSSSTGTSPTVLQTFAQRYVTALPMPRTVPEGTQCLSL